MVFQTLCNGNDGRILFLTCICTYLAATHPLMSVNFTFQVAGTNHYFDNANDKLAVAIST
jgi:hypothetical protein